MESNELQRLLGNMEDSQVELLANIAVRLAVIKAEQWTGSLTIQINTTQGSTGDMHVSRAEIVRFNGKKRRVRSSGVVD